MENFSNNSKNGERSAKSVKRSKPDKRWTILFIGNHGKTITLKRFKGMVLLTCLVLCISIAITAGLLFFSLNIRQEKKQLESDLLDLKAQIKAIRYEKDVLMTKLVVAESRSKASPDKKPQEQSASATPQQNSSGYNETWESNRPAKVQEETASGKEADPSAAENQSESGLSVAVEDFQVSPRADENLLRVQFKIKNTSPNSQRVSGHAIVVLKGEQLQQNKWLTIPRISLTDGKPTGRQRGHIFGINYFKTMRFKTNLPKSPETYQHATVFIFSQKGDLLLEQDFPVKMPATAS
ncbi:hypothetical protein D1BOALGB6SA_6363 [Olavius sp. associated proteobacterium Delta 1]|nr:hypothetical protein D1BOALGB6SA_6363 [Olavius sp. associated proteobacterium Delta 1]